MTDIRDKNVLVTGAAMGMGRRMAKAFARREANLALVDIQGDEIRQLADTLDGPGRRAEAFEVDLADRDAIEALPDRVHSRLGPVDILINNAGIVFGGRFEEVDADQDELLFDVNIRAVYQLTKSFMTDLKGGSDTHLVQMASAAGLVGMPYQVMYSASKFFVVGFSEALRQEINEENVDHMDVSIICPSLVDTGMFEGSEPPLLTPMLDPDYVVDRVVEAVEHEEIYVMEPAMVRLIPLLKAVLPTNFVDTLMEMLGATELMSSFKGRGDIPGDD
jgi:short-subunit dehydrogenase